MVFVSLCFAVVALIHGETRPVLPTPIRCARPDRPLLLFNEPTVFFNVTFPFLTTPSNMPPTKKATPTNPPAKKHLRSRLRKTAGDIHHHIDASAEPG